MRAWLAFSLAACVVLPRVAGAQDFVEAPEIIVEGEQQPDEPPTQEQVYEDRAVETEVIHAATIRELPATNAADLARHLPGLRVQSRLQGEEAAVSIEGLPPDYTRILVNGQRYSGGVGGVDDLRDIPIHALDRVEVKRGTQGVRQGGEGAGGVIEFFTRKPREQGLHANAEGGYGSDGKLLAATASEFMAGPVGVTFSALHDQIHGFDPSGDGVLSAGGGEDSLRVGRDLYGTATWSPIEKLELHSRLGWRREDENFVEFDSDDEDHPDPERRNFHRWVATEGFEWKQSAATRVTGDLTWYGTFTDSEVGRVYSEDEAEWRLNMLGEHFFETGPIGHALGVGLDLRRPSYQLDGTAPPPGVPSDIAVADAGEDFRNGAIFVEDEVALFERVSLLAGVRGELHDQFGFDVLPQVALLGKPLDTLNVRFSWGRNRRIPTLADLYQPPVAQLDGAYFLSGNPDLGTESSASWRAGFEWAPREWMTFAVTGFWHDIDDAIRSVRDRDLNIVVGTQTVSCAGRPGCPRSGFIEVEQVEPRTLFKKENLDQLRMRGFETNLRVRPHPRVELRLAYTYLETKVVDSTIDIEELANEPRHVVDAIVAVRIPRTETNIAVTGRWRSSALTEASGTGLLSFTSDEESDPSLILDMRVTQPVRKGLDLYVDLQNMTNTETVDSYSVRGFTFFVGVRADFAWQGRVLR